MSGGSIPTGGEPEGPPLADGIRVLAERLVATRPGQVYREALAVLERPLIAHVLQTVGGNQLRAARLLGLNRNTLRKRCRQLDLPLPREGREERPGPVRAGLGRPPKDVTYTTP